MPVMMICLTLVYAALAGFVWFWRLKKNATDYPLRWELAVLAGSLLPHGLMIMLPPLANQTLIMSFGYASAVIVWLMLMLYLMGSFFYRLRGLQLLLYPLSVLFMLLAILFPGHHHQSLYQYQEDLHDQDSGNARKGDRISADQSL